MALIIPSNSFIGVGLSVTAFQSQANRFVGLYTNPVPPSYGTPTNWWTEPGFSGYARQPWSFATEDLRARKLADGWYECLSRPVTFESTGGPRVFVKGAFVGSNSQGWVLAMPFTEPIEFFPGFQTTFRIPLQMLAQALCCGIS